MKRARVFLMGLSVALLALGLSRGQARREPGTSS